MAKLYNSGLELSIYYYGAWRREPAKTLLPIRSSGLGGIIIPLLPMPDLELVPKKAITLTVPAILSAKFIYCMVPAHSKAKAVKRTLQGSISTDCPATILRKHENATLFLDRDSAKLVGCVQKGK